MRKRSIVSFVIVLALIFSCAPVYAASAPAKVSNVHKISKAAGSVKVGWDKAKNAKKYQVYVSTTGKSGKYKKAATTKKKVCNLKGYKPGKTLWVKVRGVNSKKAGKFSKKVKVVTGKKNTKKPFKEPKKEPTKVVEPITDPDPYEYDDTEYYEEQPLAPGTLEMYRQQMMMFSTGNNFVYSPISVNTMLNMHQAYDPGNEIIASLQSGRDCLSYKFNSSTYKSINRIWVNEKSSIKTPEAVKKYEYVMSMQDSAKATAEKNKFVSDNTNGFITKTPTVLNSDVDYDIMNVLYFKDTWAGGDLDVAPKARKFNNTTSVNMMCAKSAYYYENDTAYMVPVRYKHGNIMLLVYPKTDISAVNLEGIENNRVYNKTCVEFPPFSSNVSFCLNDSIAGLPGNMGQTVKIEVNKKGTEAAAVSETLHCTSIDTSIPLELIFDKPFIYAIEDTANGDIAFMGMVNTL